MTLIVLSTIVFGMVTKRLSNLKIYISPSTYTVIAWPFLQNGLSRIRLYYPIFLMFSQTLIYGIHFNVFLCFQIDFYRPHPQVIHGIVPQPSSKSGSRPNYEMVLLHGHVYIWCHITMTTLQVHCEVTISLQACNICRTLVESSHHVV